MGDVFSVIVSATAWKYDMAPEAYPQWSVGVSVVLLWLVVMAPLVVWGLVRSVRGLREREEIE
jgi:hypothetical protein